MSFGADRQTNGPTKSYTKCTMVLGIFNNKKIAVYLK